MQAKRLKQNGTIGIFCPSHVALLENYAMQIAGIERMGYKVKLSKNFYKDTWGYTASAQERADDFNALIADESVDAILFNGGNGAAEILPYIDYNNIGRNPKRIGSYSDGTSILNAIHSQTGLVVYYGTAPGSFNDLRHYDYMQFCTHFVEGYRAEKFNPDSERKTLYSGQCEGVLIGGYTTLFALMISNKYFSFNEQGYILFLESHERHSTIGITAGELAFIEQTPLMDKVKGIIFGHYSVETPHNLLHCLERFGKRHNIPVLYTDDFGHGTRHGILPIGTKARLDSDNHSVTFFNCQ
ncbi:MAG: LD-carboxypeptidase [Defluviitaleaceae bacterium]|nr:LD-carboxypeptidase [Defluviitaleaceae bacterium]MCL2198979.1 LD-carboxypeptidase [Defluviitaleaceae bacterium]